MTTSPEKQVIGRFAPSPSGPLHFGSLVAAVGSYCLARHLGGMWLLRMEDLDTPRVVPGAADEILATLERLGLLWDGEVVWQSRRTEAYLAAVEVLRQRGLVFDCSCSRQEIRLSAPHPGEEGPVYPGTCRDGLRPGRQPRALRLRVSDQLVCFGDGVFGAQEQVLSHSVGDFVLRRADGPFAYQLAVVVDDAAYGVTQVVRGADLLGSTPRQIYLHACLGNPVPTYLHLPLVTDARGEKVSKRHGLVRVEHGEDAGRLIHRALVFLGQEVPESLAGASAAELLGWGVRHFEVSRVPVSTSGLTPSFIREK